MTKFCTLATLLLLAACASSASWPAAQTRVAEDVPVSFVTEDGTPAEQACRAVMIDPRDNTRLRLIRSAQLGTSHRGDYEVPGGRYGVQSGELLRIDCGTGQVIGIVSGG